MRTIILQEPGRFSLTQTPEPGRIVAGEARVRVRRVGICGTDLHAFRGRQPYFTYPRILGHELGVEIVEIGENPAGLKVGDRCAVEPYLNCGTCIACRKGKTNCCVRLQVLGVHTDGGMREYIIVPIAKLHRSETLTLEQLALVEMLGIGAHAADRAQTQAGEFALVIGAGPIGLSVIQFAKAAGASVIAMDTNPARLQFSRRLMNVDYTVGAGEGDPLETIRQITQGDLPTLVFDATGSPASMQRAFDYVAHGGRLVFVGLVQADIPVNDPEFHRRELTLLATRNASGADFQRVLGLLESGCIDTTPWITHRADASEMIAQFPDWLKPETGVIKAVVAF
jgi:2-desacetyl-2-hydroxyethyl bacteriochlorophyllide A dehydrogenase